ncbi:MAG: hypothetical protein H6R24_1086, partial [Proteobacteria bacterium]|nr:hypothetical protein [Pseudomonadota bacterium]
MGGEGVLLSWTDADRADRLDQAMTRSGTVLGKREQLRLKDLEATGGYGQAGKRYPLRLKPALPKRRRGRREPRG